MVNSAACSSRYDDDPGVGLGVGPGISETALKLICTSCTKIHIPKLSPSQNREAIISERVHKVRNGDIIRAIYGYAIAFHACAKTHPLRNLGRISMVYYGGAGVRRM